MKTKEGQKTKIRFPLNLYFKQLFCLDTYVKFINPFSFWRRHKIDHLKNCWEIDIVRYLEKCHQIEWNSNQFHPARQPLKNTVETDKYRDKSGQKISNNQIIISESNFKLKYRGVTYYKKRFKVNFSPVVLDGPKKKSAFEQINTF